MGMRHLVVRKDIVEDLGIRNVIVQAGNADFDNVLVRYGSLDGRVEVPVLKVVVFAVVSYGSKVVAVDKGGDVVLGFGRVCTGVSGFSVCRSVILEHLYDEVDLYIPGVRFTVSPLGMVYSDLREYDSDSLGFLFNVRLDSFFRERLVDGKNWHVCLRDVGEIGRDSLHGWSRVLYDLLCSRWRVPVRE